MTIRHVLFDADGVLQHVPDGWFAPLEPLLGERAEAFVLRVWELEHPMMRGEGDFVDVLQQVLDEHGSSRTPAEVQAAAWHDIALVEESIDLVHAVRAAGYGVHLASNQERHRAAYMRATLGFDELFDVSCYSYDLGHAKPSPSYFEAAVERIGIAPQEALFIDDRADNVASARSVGLAGVHWHHELGHAALREQLAAHGVVLSS